jgi:thiosulfate/3-mercaptopyruvate sulfurtransferase
MLVSPRWLEAHLDDPRVRVVEVDVSAAAYQDWHIDGAVLWNIYSDLTDPGYRLVGPAALERLAARSGIGPGSTVVCYGYAPALGVWLMKLYGHADVRILDCSRNTWRASGRPWTTAASEPVAGGFRLGAGDPRIRADPGAVLAAIGQPGTTLVDVRSAAEYRGECFWPSGSMNLAAAPATCPPLSISPSTACTTTTDRSAPPMSCAGSFPRSISTAKAS